MHSAMHRHLRHHLIRGGIQHPERKRCSSLRVHMCKNVLRCSCDKPFCCASSRCSPPQRRALPRRVAPFSDAREAALLVDFPSAFAIRHLILAFGTFFFFFSLLLLWCETQEPPSSSYFHCDSSLAFPPRRDSFCRRVGAAARKHFMQIAVGVTSDEGEVIGAGAVPAPLSGPVGTKGNHDCNRVWTRNRTLSHTGMVRVSIKLKQLGVTFNVGYGIHCNNGL